MIHRYTILITGATGFCGSYLSEYFKNKNKEIQVYTTSRKKQSNSNHIQHDLSIPVPTNLFPKKIDFFFSSRTQIALSWPQYFVPIIFTALTPKF